MPEASLQSCGVGPEGCEVWRNQRNQLTALWLRGAKADFWRAREGREGKKTKKEKKKRARPKKESDGWAWAPFHITILD